MCTARNLELLTLHSCSSDIQMQVSHSGPSEVNSHPLVFIAIERYCRLLFVHHSANWFTSSRYGDSSLFLMRPITVANLTNVIGVVVCVPFMSQQCKQKWTEHTVLGSACVEVMLEVVLPIRLGSHSQKVQDPVAEAGG